MEMKTRSMRYVHRKKCRQALLMKLGRLGEYNGWMQRRVLEVRARFTFESQKSAMPITIARSNDQRHAVGARCDIAAQQQVCNAVVRSHQTFTGCLSR
eukprot:3604656-Rhodomonas_salina.1